MTLKNKATKEDLAGVDPSKFAVEIWEIEKIHPYENNAKIHTEEQVSRIAESIRRFGWQSVITVNEEGVIIAGHGRRLAALKLGLKKIPVRVARGLSYDEERALRIADNKVSEAEHDVNILNKELKELADLEFDLTGLLDERELKFLTEDLGFIDINAITPDLTSDVRHQSESTSQKIDEVDGEDMPLSKIFGASNIKAADGRKLQLFQAYVEGITGKEGILALIAYADRVMSDATEEKPE